MFFGPVIHWKKSGPHLPIPGQPRYVRPHDDRTPKYRETNCGRPLEKVWWTIDRRRANCKKCLKK